MLPRLLVGQAPLIIHSTILKMVKIYIILRNVNLMFVSAHVCTKNMNYNFWACSLFKVLR